jgi:ADP-ribosyl-[dinitrogen reductase] hydrolase
MTESTHTTDITLADRYQGCLLGLACGDALGGPVEFKSRAEIAAAHPHGVREFIGGGWLHLAPGEITDDTQMTLALAQSLVDCGQLDMDDVAQRFVDWYRTDPKDIGNTTRAAILHLANGVPWSDAGERVARGGKAAGNGSVMRCAPIALRYRTNRLALRQASIDSARVTHADPRCTWGAVALNQAIVHLLDSGSLIEVIDAAADGLEHEETKNRTIDAANRSADQIKSGGYVLDTLSAALWCLLRHESFEETVVAAVALGADTDTTGAVAGALAGALYGAQGLPNRWLKLLQPRDELIQLAMDLLEQSSSPFARVS